MANSISAELAAVREELAAVREELAALTAIVAEVLESVRPGAVEVLPAIIDEPTLSGVKLVDGQLVDVPKGEDK